jgi:archaellum component FlaC
MNNLFDMVYDPVAVVDNSLQAIAQNLRELRLELAEDNKRAEEKEMVTDDNVFPFGKFGIMDSGNDDKLAGMVAVLNGVQNNMLVILKKLDDVERRLHALEDKTGKGVD